MAIFKKKKSEGYETSQPEIDFNHQENVSKEVLSSNPEMELQPSSIPFHRVTFEEYQKTIAMEMKSVDQAINEDFQVTTGFVADSYHDAPRMADMLLTKGQLIIHLEKLTQPERIRTLDFLTGVMYAFNGTVTRIEHKTYEFIIGQ